MKDISVQIRDSRRSLTATSSRIWLYEHELEFQDYLREKHDEKDWEDVSSLIFHSYPDQGKKLVENYLLSSKEKLFKVFQWIAFSKQLTGLVFGDQGMGKDTFICRLFELYIHYCFENNLPLPRIVTLGNVKCPPFVLNGNENTDFKYFKENFNFSKEDLLLRFNHKIPVDMYFDLIDIPFGSVNSPVFIYCSELDSEFPARDFQGKENKMFSVLQNTFRHNHQKLIGGVKLSANIDISLLRTCNLKFFKYISPEKLDVPGVERDNLLTDLGRWFLPKDVRDPSQTLMCFDNNLLTIKTFLPSFWSDSYSEQFQGGTIPKYKIYSFVKSKFDDGSKNLTVPQINDMKRTVYLRFRYKISSKEIKECYYNE